MKEAGTIGSSTIYQRIYDLVRQVPSGYVTTYGQVARLVGHCTARMVGYAMAATPSGSDVPWHRVINSKGAISTRSGGHGGDIQRRMLELEEIAFDRNGRVDLKTCLWPGPPLQEEFDKVEIRPYEESDEAAVVRLWQDCGLVAPQNDPLADIRAKTAWQPELFFVGERGGRVVATAMAGYDGHRGWINYLAVSPDLRRQGLGRLIMDHCEAELRDIGCLKINLQVRETNQAVIDFYHKIGFRQDRVVSLGKRL